MNNLPAAVLWDLDGTLLDSEKLWDIPLYELAEQLGGTLAPEIRHAMVGTNVPTTMSLLFGAVGIEPTEAQVADAIAYIDGRMVELFATKAVFRPGAEDALRAVRATGVPTALVTSTGRALAEIALDTVGREFFDVTVCGDEVDGLNKPLPEPYLKAARLLGVDPARCVAIEDSPTGVAAGVAAGCVVLVVPCDVPVAEGERRVFRESLVGVGADVLRDMFLSFRR
ncbi:possible hydrolase [Alloactinosynnema sp. L-07]|uniref:HAD family hydrolase n=1 Tax=Alloactinosynnema sp. L-07 TaxID=1653480 RepID=UPI00065EFB98|nr:HAD family phosphatase [Alloactinosynnema sp. L-07]CRK56407.1 possible hydrolase [Alloactinosynnema sp. L-07]